VEAKLLVELTMYWTCLSDAGVGFQGCQGRESLSRSNDAGGATFCIVGTVFTET
jgi:hypothetical protein